MLAARRMLIQQQAALTPVTPAVDTGGIVNNATTISSFNAFTPAANTAIFVAAEWNEPSAPTTTGISDTIGGLTWTEITNGWHSMTSGGSTRYAKTSLFWAVTGSTPPNGKITVTSSAACAITFKPFTVPSANSSSPVGNQGFANVTSSFTAPASVTGSVANSGAGLVVAVLGLGGVTVDPTAPTEDTNFTRVVFYGGAAPVRAFVDIAYSHAAHTATWTPAAWTSQFQYYDAILVEIN